MALRTRAPLARLVLPNHTNPHPALHLLQLECPSTLQAAISEAKMMGLHLLGAGKGQKQGSRGCHQKVECNSEWGP